jgi:hypothetical protein
MQVTACLSRWQKLSAVMAARDRLGDLFESGADMGDGTLPLLLADLLIGAAEHEEDAAGNEFAAVGVADVMTDHSQLVAFLGQGGVALSAALLFNGQEAGLVLP